MTLRILTVCTANVCRSPIAARLLAGHLSAVGVAALVGSVGTHGGQLAMHRDTLEAALALGCDASDHVSRPLTGAVVRDEGADLVIGMTREHLREVVALEPAAWPRTFTLKELARAAARVGPARGDVAGWVMQASEGRRASELMVPSAEDDLADPYGRERRYHDSMVREVDQLTQVVARALGS